MFPSCDPTLLAGRAARLDPASLTDVGPVTPHHQAAFLGRVPNCQRLTCRAPVDIRICVIGKVGLHISALLAVARGLGSGEGRGDAILVTGQDFPAAEVALVCHRAHLVARKHGLRSLGHRR